MNETTGRVNTCITDVFCIISSVIKGKSLSSTLERLIPYWRPWSAALRDLPQPDDIKVKAVET